MEQQRNQYRARGSQELARFLTDYEYKHVFGLPGSTSASAFYEFQNCDATFVPTIHESVTVAAADGYARIAGSSVAMLYLFPGVANGLANLYNAWRDETPLILIGAQQASAVRTPGWTVCEADLVTTTRPYTRFAHEVTREVPLRPWLETARRMSRGPVPGPVFLSVLQDVMEEQAPVRDVRVARHPEPVSVDVTAVADALRDAERPLIVVGGQLRRRGGAEAIEALSTAAAIPLAYESGMCDRLGVAPGHANSFGNVIFGATPAEQTADTVLVIGARYMFDAHARPEWFPDAKFIAHVNADPASVETTRAADWSAACDSGAFAKALRDALAKNPPSAEQIEARSRWIKSLREADKGPMAEIAAPYLNVVSHLHDALDHGWVVDESVLGVFALQQTLSATDGTHYIGTSGSSLGWATGAAAGVALASGEPVTCLLGDGALRFGALGLWTIRACNLPITLFILDNGGYGSTRMFEQVFVEKLGPEARPQRPGYLGSDLHNLGPRVGDIVQGFGIPCRTLKNGEDIRAAALEAWEGGRKGPNALVIPFAFANS